MLRDNLVGLIEPMLCSAGAQSSRAVHREKTPSGDRPPCLENPRPEKGRNLTLKENVPSPFQVEPGHIDGEAPVGTR